MDDTLLERIDRLVKAYISVPINCLTVSQMEVSGVERNEKKMGMKKNWIIGLSKRGCDKRTGCFILFCFFLTKKDDLKIWKTNQAVLILKRVVRIGESYLHSLLTSNDVIIFSTKVYRVADYIRVFTNYNQMKDCRHSTSTSLLQVHICYMNPRSTSVYTSYTFSSFTSTFIYKLLFNLLFHKIDTFELKNSFMPKKLVKRKRN